MSAICDAYTCKGTKCTKALFGDYCKEHQNSMKMIGPMRFRQNQERIVAKLKIKTACNKHIDEHTPESWTAYLVAKSELNGLNAQHADERCWGPHTLADHQSYERLARKLRNRKEIREGVREPQNLMHRLRGDGRDELLEIRQARLHYIDMVERREMTIGNAYDAFDQAQHRIYREQNRRDVWNDEQGERDYHINYGNAIPNVVDGDNWLNDNEPPRERTLADIAADRQNIHTSEVVKKFKEMVEVIRKIEVPEEYRWSMTKMSKTMVEIISECDLTPQAAWQFSSKYCADDTIYDMEAGIFGKLMDAVWQHVKNLDDPASLKQIVKEELEMNIGTCAQGNLTRVANILVGILDGLNPEEESRLNKIGRAINDVRRTLTMSMTRAEIVLATMKVLVPFGMTAAEMKPWVDAVVDAAE